MTNNYIIIGDSIVYGIGGYSKNGWVSMLKNKLLNEEGTKESTNFVHCVGFPGATSKDILEKIEAIFNTYYSDDMNNIFFISIGVNDTQIFKGNLKISIDEYENNITEIINYIKGKENCSIIFAGLTSIKQKDKPFFWKTDKYYDYKTIVNYDKVLKKVCRNNDVKYVPMLDVLVRSDFIDGLHTNDEGYNKIFDRVYEQVILKNICNI